MTTQRGFTILEMLMAMVLVGLLVVGIMFAYLTCFRAFDSGQDRITIRTKLSQAMDLMARELSNAQSITSCTSTSLTFNANLGGALTANTLALSGSNLVTDGGVTRATGIQTPGKTIANIFACSNGLVTIDMTAVQNGTSVRLQNNVIPRNMPIGLVGWWQFDEASSGTCSGAVLIDSSGNGNTGTCNNNPTWTTGALASDPINGALSVNSSNSQDVSSATNVGTPAVGFSISAWFNTASASGTKIVGLENAQTGTGGSGYDRHLYMGTDGKIYFGVWDGSCHVVTSLSTLNNGAWHHALGTNDGTTSTLYIDGVSQGTTSGGAQTGYAAGYWRIGSYKLNGWLNGVDGYFNGIIDDVRIYNRVLSASEVSQLYNAGIGN